MIEEYQLNEVRYGQGKSAEQGNDKFLSLDPEDILEFDLFQ